jgi:hypothetical protein
LVDISFKDMVIGEENLNRFRYEIGGKEEPIEDDATDRKEQQKK